MTEFVSVRPATRNPNVRTLKQDALLFDRLAFPFRRSIITQANTFLSSDSKDFIRDFDWLLDKGVAFTVEDSFIDVREHPDYIEADKLLDTTFIPLVHLTQDYIRKIEGAKKLGFPGPALPVPINKIWQLIRQSNNYYARVIAAKLRITQHMDAFPCFDNINPLREAKGRKEQVVHITLNNIPFPESDTPWEKIMEFRSDPDSRYKLLELRNWINDISQSKFSSIEVEQKLEFLMSSYRRHLEIHKMKSRRGRIEAIVVSTAEFMEDIANRKFSKVAKSFFAIRAQEVSLLETEMTTPGKEVAYVVKSQEAFSSRLSKPFS